MTTSPATANRALFRILEWFKEDVKEISERRIGIRISNGQEEWRLAISRPITTNADVNSVMDTRSKAKLHAWLDDLNSKH